MRAEVVAYMIYLEEPEYPEDVMHIFYLKYSGTPKYGNMLGNSLPVGPTQETTGNCLEYSGCPQKRIMLCIIFFQKVFPGILQVIISNGMVWAWDVVSHLVVSPLHADLILHAWLKDLPLHCGVGEEREAVGSLRIEMQIMTQASFSLVSKLERNWGSDLSEPGVRGA